MNKMEKIKVVPGCVGGSGGRYGRVSLPQRYIGKTILIRIASDNEIKRIGIDEIGRGRLDVKGDKRIKKRKSKLDKHLIKLKELRTKRKYAIQQEKEQ